MSSVNERAHSPTGAELAAGSCPDRIVPPAAAPRDDSVESLSVWGFRDTAFELLPNRSVMRTGGRYSLCGSELPDLIPWAEEQLEMRIDPGDVHTPSYPPDIPEPRADPAFLAELRGRAFLTGAFARPFRARLPRLCARCRGPRQSRSTARGRLAASARATGARVRASECGGSLRGTRAPRRPRADRRRLGVGPRAPRTSRSAVSCTHGRTRRALRRSIASKPFDGLDPALGPKRAQLTSGFIGSLSIPRPFEAT
jgi:hypothetical protein